jgi:AmmeMemoRadiSam system protein A
MARTQLEKAIKEARPVDPKDYGWVLTPKLQADGAVFVTLTNHGELRGCIGDIIAHQPLYQSVLVHTVNSALRDYRFAGNPITAKELPDIDIEISYLTPMRRIANYTEIVVGKHGVLLEKEGLRAVFLPQVATEQKWDRDTMLKFLSLKAGLPPDAWKEGCTFHVFEAQVFGEKELGKSRAEEKK